MKCPVCPGKALHPHVLTEDLVSSKCDACGGQWINSFQYWKWLEAHPSNSSRSYSSLTLQGEGDETARAKVCPECQHILTRHRVGHAVNFTLDRCGNCGGMWFDRNEWDILQNSELRDQIHLVFSATWQSRVREESARIHLEELFAKKIGEEDYSRLKEMKCWLDGHPHRDDLIHFLNS